MSTLIRRQIGIGLALLILGFASTAASEVFFPAVDFCRPWHNHYETETSFCGHLTELPATHCIHSTTTLDVATAYLPIERSESVERTHSCFGASSGTPAFDYYHLRAPPVTEWKRLQS